MRVKINDELTFMDNILYKRGSNNNDIDLINKVFLNDVNILQTGSEYNAAILIEYIKNHIDAFKIMISGDMFDDDRFIPSNMHDLKYFIECIEAGINCGVNGDVSKIPVHSSSFMSMVRPTEVHSHLYDVTNSMRSVDLSSLDIGIIHPIDKVFVNRFPMTPSISTFGSDVFDDDIDHSNDKYILYLSSDQYPRYNNLPDDALIYEDDEVTLEKSDISFISVYSIYDLSKAINDDDSVIDDIPWD